jgi:hypothetical protein
VYMPQNMPIRRLKVAVLPLDLTCSELVTHSGKILTTGKSHKKNPVIFTYVLHIKPTTRRKIVIILIPNYYITSIYTKVYILLTVHLVMILGKWPT